MKEMVLPEDETKICNESLVTQLEDSNQQIKKWLTRWKPVIEHSMKRVKELAQDNTKPIWQQFTANKPAKTRVSRKLSTRKHARTIRMTNNPLTNVYIRMHKERSLSRVIKATTRRYKKTDLISQMYKKLGKNRSTSRDKAIQEVEEQVIEDRFGDVPK
jgi:RecA-family ATPase